jgi:hypothetical protein
MTSLPIDSLLLNNPNLHHLQQQDTQSDATSSSTSSNASSLSTPAVSSPSSPSHVGNAFKKQVSSPSVLVGQHDSPPFSPPSHHSIPSRDDDSHDSKPLLEYVNTAQYILLLLIQQFERQAEIVIDNFAYDGKATDVTTLVDSSVFSQAAPRSTSGWTNSAAAVHTSSFSDIIPSTSSSTSNEYEVVDPTSTSGNIPVVSTGKSIDAPVTSQMSENTEVETTQNAYMDQFYRLNNAKDTKSDDNKAFEKLLAAFATVSKHSLNPTIEALYDWRVHLNTKPTQQVKDKVEEQFRFYTKKATVRQEALLSQFTERKEVSIFAFEFSKSINILISGCC